MNYIPGTLGMCGPFNCSITQGARYCHLRPHFAAEDIEAHASWGTFQHCRTGKALRWHLNPGLLALESALSTTALSCFLIFTYTEKRNPQPPHLETVRRCLEGSWWQAGKDLSRTSSSLGSHWAGNAAIRALTSVACPSEDLLSVCSQAESSQLFSKN